MPLTFESPHIRTISILVKFLETEQQLNAEVQAHNCKAYQPGSRLLLRELDNEGIYRVLVCSRSFTPWLIQLCAIQNGDLSDTRSAGSVGPFATVRGLRKSLMVFKRQHSTPRSFGESLRILVPQAFGTMSWKLQAPAKQVLSGRFCSARIPSSPAV